MTPVSALPIKPQYLTCKQVARLLGIHPSTVRRWIDSNNLPPPIELGPNRTVWSVAEIDAWRAEKEAASRPRPEVAPGDR